MYAKADFDDEDTRNQVLEYFVDKIYVYNDRLVITWYYSDDKTSIDLDALTEITETSESNTVDRVSTLLQSDPYTFLPYESVFPDSTRHPDPEYPRNSSPVSV